MCCRTRSSRRLLVPCNTGSHPQPRRDVFTTTVTQAEMAMGIGLLSHGMRRSTLAGQIRTLFEQVFAGRILPFDSRAAEEFEHMPIRRNRHGEPTVGPDEFIAAIARAHGAALATRNLKHFALCGIPLINPWTA